MEVTHTDLSEVTGVVLVNVGAVVVLTTLKALLVTSHNCIRRVETYGHTTTTGMLPVLSDTSVTSGDVYTIVSLVSFFNVSLPAQRLVFLPFFHQGANINTSASIERRREKCGGQSSRFCRE